MMSDLFLVVCVVALVLVAPESKAGRSAEEMFDEKGAYIYETEEPKQRYEEAQREMERTEIEYKKAKMKRKKVQGQTNSE